MANFNVQAFMDSLSAEMQEKVKVCKTEEELAVLIEAEGIDLTAFAENEEDIELTLEDLEGVGGGRQGFPADCTCIGDPVHKHGGYGCKPNRRNYIQ